MAFVADNLLCTHHDPFCRGLTSNKAPSPVSFRPCSIPAPLLLSIAAVEPNTPEPTAAPIVEETTSSELKCNPAAYPKLRSSPLLMLGALSRLVER